MIVGHYTYNLEGAAIAQGILGSTMTIVSNGTYDVVKRSRIAACVITPHLKGKQN